VTQAFRPTWVEVDLAAIRHNVGVLRETTGTQLMVVVKADGYGHGAVEIARAAAEAGAAWFGVALVEEGLQLRGAGLETPILVLSELPPGAEAVALAARLTPAIGSEAAADRLAATARGTGIGVHVKVDTGMHRQGVWPPVAAAAVCDRVAAAGLVVEGLWTHLACADEGDPVVTEQQLATFRDVVTQVEAAGHRPGLVHAANSAAAITHTSSRLDLVRMGIATYGIEPAPGIAAGLGLRPAMRWRSAVSATRRLAAGEAVSYGHAYRLDRPSWIATVPVGYADGYPRAASSRAEAVMAGVRCRVVGNVTMDQLLVDGGDNEPAVGDEVVLLGGDGVDAIDVWELAGYAGSIAYEIVTRIGARVPRRYVG